MDTYYRPTWAEISLDALRHNLLAFRELLPDRIGMMAVVKANAYGHGAIEVAREALECGASYLAVAFLDEALELRRAGITAPILILGYTPVQGIALALKYNISLNVYTEDVLEALSAAAAADHSQAKIHIKIDTGMGRIGLQAGSEATAFIEKALRLPGIQVEGIFTHYACADETDKTYTLRQYERFRSVLDHFADEGVEFPLVHAGNSATAIDTPELTYNMVRLGISMYGLYPSDEVQHGNIDLQPVLSLKTGIVHLKSLPEGSGVSYGAIYRTKHDGERIATLPIGYADGFSRMLTKKAYALVRGQRVPVVGKICMDQCMIDVSGVDGVNAEDEVVLIGRQGEETISADDLARELDTINYEVTCMISERVPRVYIKDGRVVNTVNFLQHHA